jgi:hypothetical protein
VVTQLFAEVIVALTTNFGFRASNGMENKNRKVAPAIGTVIASPNRLPVATPP